MNNNPNPGEHDSQFSVASNCPQRDGRRDLKHVISQIMEVLSNDFDSIWHDESLILNLKRLINRVGVHKDYLTDVDEFLSCD